MDGLKLERWRENFQKEAQHLQIELDSFFKNKSLDKYYKLRVDELSETLSVEITDETLPGEIKHRLEDLLIATKPEDSV